MAHAQPITSHPPELTVDVEFEDRKLHAAECRLREFSDVAREAAREDLATGAKLFADLLEIVRSHGEDGPLSGEVTAIMDFVRTGLPLLRAAKGKTDRREELAAAIAEVQERWGDHIRLLDETTSPLLVDEMDLAHGDFFITHAVVEHDISRDSGGTEIEQPTAEEIELILSACEAEPDQPSPEGQEQMSSPSGSPGESAAGIDAAQSGVTLPLLIGALPEAGPASLDGELLEAYLDDARSCLASMEEAIMAFESDSSRPEPLHRLCRDLHTLKGASASVGLAQLASQLHAVEDKLSASCIEKQAPDIEMILGSVDAIRRQIDAVSNRPAPADRDGLVQQCDPSAGAGPAATVELNESLPSDETVRVRASQLDRLMDMLAELVMLRNLRQSRVAELDQISTRISRCVSQLQPLRRRGDGGNTVGGPEHLSGRYDLANPYAEPMGELLEATKDLRELREPIAEENQAISQFVRQFRQELTQLRRLPIVGLFRRLQRAARDAARAEGKQVRMQQTGKHSGLERSLQEQLYAPLLHIVRNAVSHGIETQSDRVAAGKDPVGQVTIEVRGGANLLMVVVRDDGAGLDYEAVRRRGIERGWIAADRPVTRQELAQLIFRPGFSTRKGSSEVAGRGVGMDVVATTLERMRGWIEVESDPGQGTSVCLAVPLRGVIDHAMVFRAGGQLFAMPMSYVIRAKSSSSESHHHTWRDERGEGEPVIYFTDFLSNGNRERPAASHELIIGDGHASHVGPNVDRPGAQKDGSRQPRRLSVLVDEILGPEEVVVRPLPPLLARQALFSAVTLAGTGEIVFLIDGRYLLDVGCRGVPCAYVVGTEAETGQPIPSGGGNE